MAYCEYDKVFLNIDGVFRKDGYLFGKEWDEARKRQLVFLLERPLHLKILTENIWGPAGLDVLSLAEWKEVEGANREPNSITRKKKMRDEIADMDILLLTTDSIKAELLIPSQISLVNIVHDQVLGKYCADLKISREQLIPQVLKKIKINSLRNPPEAFCLVPGEDMETSKQRRDHNWKMLKKYRGKMPSLLTYQNWWKRWLVIDAGGWVNEVRQTGSTK